MILLKKVGLLDGNVDNHLISLKPVFFVMRIFAVRIERGFICVDLEIMENIGIVLGGHDVEDMAAGLIADGRSRILQDDWPEVGARSGFDLYGHEYRELAQGLFLCFVVLGSYRHEMIAT